MARHRTAWLVTLLLAGAVAGPAVTAGTDAPVAVGVAGAPAATNGLAEFTLKPGGTVAEPGETVPLVVFLRSSPQVASGAYEADFVLAFDTIGLRATNVTRGRFMRQGENTTVRTNQSAIDNEAGVVRFGLARDPANGGVTGYARFATVTFEVREDAPVGIYDVVFRRASVLLTDDGYQQVTTYGANVKVSPRATETATATATPETERGAALGVAAVLAAVGVLVVVLLLVRRA